MKLPNGYGSITKVNKKTRKPFWARAPEEIVFDHETNEMKSIRPSLGYYASQKEALAALAENYKKRNILKSSSITFEELFKEWSAVKFTYVGISSQRAYLTAFKHAKPLHHMRVKEIQLCDLENTIKETGKYLPTAKSIKLLFTQLFDYAYMHNIVEMNFAVWVNLKQYKNVNRKIREPYSNSDIDMVWNNYHSKNEAIILMMLYSGVRVRELLNLKRENVHLDENYFEITSSKTSNGIRLVPIAKKVKPFYEEWFNDPNNQSEYLLCNNEGMHLTYEKFKRKIYDPFTKSLGINLTPHCTRHTTITLLTKEHVPQTTIKKIVGHAGAMDVTEKVYVHLDVQELIDAINLI